jgi:tetratricopeptide (TPR) repeat protein
MYQFIIILVLAISSVLIPVHAQTKYETEMEKALNEFSSSKTADEMEKVAQHFDRIAKVEKENWLPLYYSMFIRTLNAFGMDKNAAIKKANELEETYGILETLNPDKSEILALRGLFRTVKVAKDPETYGMSLSGAIIKDYDEALKINPNNPRAMYLMAQYNMGGAQFWGKDPKDYCGPVEKAKTLFPAEKPANFLPNWGEQQVDEILNTTCKK